jgi:hypothetical protein
MHPHRMSPIEFPIHHIECTILQHKQNIRKSSIQNKTNRNVIFYIIITTALKGFSKNLKKGNDMF